MADAPVCYLCREPAPANELAAYTGRCENCSTFQLPRAGRLGSPGTDMRLSEFAFRPPPPRQTGRPRKPPPPRGTK